MSARKQNAAGTVLILGASRGIGESTAKALARAGFQVGVGCRKLGDARRVAEEACAAGGEAIPIEVDVTSDSRIQNAVTMVRDWAGRLDALVNNAGLISPIGPLDSIDGDDWARLIEVNLVGAYRGVRHALPQMTSGGVVVNLSSGAASKAMEGWSAYCASKAGLAMLTKSIHEEFGSKGIYAYGFRPGVVDTEMQAQIRGSGINPISQLRREDLIPADMPAMAICWLIRTRPPDLAGQEVDIRDPLFSQRISQESRGNE